MAERENRNFRGCEKDANVAITFGLPDQRVGKSRIRYVVSSICFLHLRRETSVNPPPAKRQKIAAAREHQANGDAEIDSVDEPERGVVLSR